MENVYVSGIKIIERIKNEIDYNQFPFNLSVVKYIDNFEFTTPVTIILGENGVGKSTLIEAIAILLGLNAEGGNKNLRFSTYNSHSNLHEYITLQRVYLPKNVFSTIGDCLFLGG